MLTTKDRIRHEAVRLFAERGIDAVSLRDIAAAAGIQVSTLYAHWTGGRDQLIAELFAAGYADYAERLTVAAAPHPGFAPALDAMVRTICRLHGEDGAMFAFLLLSQHRACPASPATRRKTPSMFSNAASSAPSPPAKSPPPTPR